MKLYKLTIRITLLAGILTMNSVSISAQVVTTIAFNGNPTYLNSPYGIAVDNSGNVYVSDWHSNDVIKINTVSNTVSRLGLDLYRPVGLALDALGNLYVSNTNSPDNNSGGIVVKLSNTGVKTFLTGGDSLKPMGLAVDLNGNVYFADRKRNKIKKINSNGVLTTLAGGGTGVCEDGIGKLASFNSPTGVAVDANGNVYVVDRNNNRIRKITPTGLVSTLAGNGCRGGGFGNTDGIGTSASFNSPFGIAVDATGDMYVTDNGNSKIRKITSSGVVSTLAGSGISGNSNGIATAASFSGVAGITLDESGNIYVSELDYNNDVRKITFTISPTGLNNDFVEEEQLSLFPNPVLKTLHIQSSVGISQAEAKSASGTSYKLKQTEDNAFDVSTLSAGLYFITIKMENDKSKILKFIKQ